MNIEAIEQTSCPFCGGWHDEELMERIKEVAESMPDEYPQAFACHYAIEERYEKLTRQ